MIDLTNKLEVFIITNGRSTFEYCHRAIEDQEATFKIKVIRDMKWVDALNACLEQCETPHFLRVDDDFVLHKHALPYMWEVFRKHPNVGRMSMYLCLLWEDWTRKIAGGVKIYNKDIVKKLGGFKASKRFGKVDKVFYKAVRRSRYIYTKNKSIVGLHTMGEWKEQLRYEKLWSDQSAAPYQKVTHKRMKRYSKDLEYQWSLRGDFLKRLNRKKRTQFYKYLTQIPKTDAEENS